MSIQPKNYTHTTILDFDFSRKYNLTPTQSYVMSYLRNIPSWATDIGDKFFLLTTNKINNDLQFNEKTVAGAITRLKKLGLIKTKMVEYSEWSDYKKFRAIKITDSGMKYSLNFARPKEDKIIVDLKKEIEDLKIKSNATDELIRKLQDENMKLKDSLFKSREEIKKISQLPPQNQEKDEFSKSRGNNSLTQEVNKDFFLFKQRITKKFANSNLPICNAVEGWHYKTEFVINSYNKLSIITPKGEYKQLANPKEIDNFWQWLYKNQERIGDVRGDEEWESLLFFIGFFVLMNKRKYKIHNFQKASGGVKMQLKAQDGEIIKIVQPKTESEILNIEDCKKWLEKGAFRE